MSIATAITNLQGKIANAYTAIENKGGTLPATQDAENLSATIEAMPTGGGGPDYGTGGLSNIFYTPNGDGENMKWFGNVSSITFTGIKSIADMNFAFYNNNGVYLKSVSFPDLEVLSGDSSWSNSFYFNRNLSSITFPKVSAIVNANNLFSNAFTNCYNLSSLSFPEVKYIIGGSSSYATNGIFGTYNSGYIKEVSFPKLEYVDKGCPLRMNTLTSITQLTFPELTAVYCSISSVSSDAGFSQNGKITALYLPKLSVMTTSAPGTPNPANDLSTIFSGCGNLVEIHFGAANESILTAATGYATKWGASNATIYFDL